jgi:lipopolysaccharide transport system ATP-binding protein
MSQIVLKAENISKQYRLGQLGTGTISHDLNRFIAKIRGKEDPYLKVGDTNDRTIIGSSDYVWSLKDINFQLSEGEVLGVIGKNGAGKSTLLKILSQVTTPTIGQVKVKGRIAALLEVGTGFHPELTGRENIFLNGAILGMTKIEIKSKLDEIIEFSGVAKYIDTPVKRYSSGMMVRLAFAVAAYLEPEILIVDEVLAVGDKEFQDKCIGKMKDVSSQGRTVIFVSHNMGAVKMLCDRAILLEQGKCVSDGLTTDVINTYFEKDDEQLKNNIVPRTFKRLYNNGQGFIDYVTITDTTRNPKNSFFFKEPFSLLINFELLTDVNDLLFSISILNNEMEKISYYEYPESSSESLTLKKGSYQLFFKFEDKFLPGKYHVRPCIFKFNGDAVDYIERVALFEVKSDSVDGSHNYKWNEKHGNSFMKLTNIDIKTI